MPEHVDLARADDLRDVIHRVVACLAKGGVVALVTDSGHRFLASALHASAVGRTREWLDSATGGATPAATLLIGGAEELADWVDFGSALGWKLPGRVWPGPVTLHVAVSSRSLADRLPAEIRAFVVVDGRFAVQAPADRVIRQVLALTPGPLIQVDGSTLGAEQNPPPMSIAADLAGFESLDMILESPKATGDRRPATVVGIDADGWRIVRPGSTSERTLRQWAGTIILFVCTGNTCRSPMAEALCKAVLARKVGCGADDLVDHGYVVLSAGVAASDGMPAAANAIEVVQGRGGSLVEHSSRQVTPELARIADHILAMTWDHLDILVEQIPEVADRVRLLDPEGIDIDDPVGMDRQTYGETARAIEQNLEHLARELGL